MEWFLWRAGVYWSWPLAWQIMSPIFPAMIGFSIAQATLRGCALPRRARGALIAFTTLATTLIIMLALLTPGEATRLLATPSPDEAVVLYASRVGRRGDRLLVRRFDTTRDAMIWQRPLGIDPLLLYPRGQDELWIIALSDANMRTVSAIRRLSLKSGALTTVITARALEMPLRLEAVTDDAVWLLGANGAARKVGANGPIQRVDPEALPLQRTAPLERHQNPWWTSEAVSPQAYATRDALIDPRWLQLDDACGPHMLARHLRSDARRGAEAAALTLYDVGGQRRWTRGLDELFGELGVTPHQLSCEPGRWRIWGLKGSQLLIATIDPASGEPLR